MQALLGDSLSWSIKYDQSSKTFCIYNKDGKNLWRPLVREWVKLTETSRWATKQVNVDGFESNMQYVEKEDSDGAFVLNEKTNPVPIHYVLSQYVKPWEVWKIDYTNCKSQNIKNKMLNCIWWWKTSCYISYNQDTKTYNLFNEKWDLLQQRALIWAGVKLYPPYLINYEGVKDAQKKAEDQANKKMNTLSDEKETELLNRIPKKLKDIMSEDVQKQFIKYTENVLNSAIISARKNGEQLSGEPIKYKNDWKIYLRTVTPVTNRIRELYPNENFLSKYPKLKDALRGKEREIQTYFNLRVWEKWSDASYFANTDIIEIKSDNEASDLLNEGEIQNAIQWVSLLKEMFENYKSNVVSKRYTLNQKDTYVAAVENLIANLESTILQWKCTKNMLDKTIKDLSDNIQHVWLATKNIQNLEKLINKILTWNNNERLLSARELSQDKFLWISHDTSYISESFREWAITESGEVEITKEKYDECFKKIETLFLVPENTSFNENWELDCPEAKNIDKLYNCENWAEVLTCIKDLWLIPEWAKDKKFEDVCNKIFNNIKWRKEQINSYINDAEMNHRQWLEDQCNEIKLKTDKTPEDISLLNKFEYLLSEEGTNALNEIMNKSYLATKKAIKYSTMTDLLKWTLGVSLATLWWWLKWDSDIIKEFNDSVGAGFLNLRDEWVEKTVSITKEVIKEVIICVVAMAITDWAYSAVIAGKLWKLGKWWKRVVSWVVKWSLFNMTNLTINNTLDVITERKIVTELWEWINIFKDRNREWYAWSAAFFAIMEMVPVALIKVWSRIWGKQIVNALVKSWNMAEKEATDLLLKVSNSWNIEQFMNLSFSTKEVGNLLKALETAWAKTTAFWVELWSMLLANEVTTLMSTWGFERISEDELIHTIAMILAFKWVWKIKSIIKWKDGNPVIEIEKDGKVREVTEEELNWWKEEEDRLKRLQDENSKKQEDAEKRKVELQNRKSELERQRKENRNSLQEWEIWIQNVNDILSKKNNSAITIYGLKYNFIGVKWWKAQFVIKESAKWSDLYKKMNPKPKDLIEITDLADLKDPRFNLEPSGKDNNSWRYEKLDKLLNTQKIEPLDRLQNKISNKKSEITTLQEQISRLEKWKNTIAHNDYFETNKSKLIWKNVWIDWVEYKASFIDWQWALKFTNVDWKSSDFTISSFSQLKAKWQVNWFSDWLSRSWTKIKWSETLSRSETENHKSITELLTWEQEYLSNRNIDSEIAWKKAELLTLNEELNVLNSKLSDSEAQAAKIKERAKKWEEINKELNKVNEELHKVEKQLEETKRLAKKYTDEISKLESDKNSKETKTTESEWKVKQHDIRETINQNSKKTTEITTQEYVDIIKNNSKEILRLNEINNHEEFCRESFKFLTEKLGITEAKIKLVEIKNLTYFLP